MIKEDFEDDDMMMEDDDGCPYADIILSAALSPKPFGLVWDQDKIENFLKNRGYKIIQRTDEDGEYFNVAVKPDSKIIPDYRNTREVFNDELQDIILSWLAKQ